METTDKTAKYYSIRKVILKEMLLARKKTQMTMMQCQRLKTNYVQHCRVSE